MNRFLGTRHVISRSNTWERVKKEAVRVGLPNKSYSLFLWKEGERLEKAERDARGKDEEKGFFYIIWKALENPLPVKSTFGIDVACKHACRIVDVYTPQPPLSLTNAFPTTVTNNETQLMGHGPWPRRFTSMFEFFLPFLDYKYQHFTPEFGSSQSDSRLNSNIELSLNFVYLRRVFFINYEL